MRGQKTFISLYHKVSLSTSGGNEHYAAHRTLLLSVLQHTFHHSNLCHRVSGWIHLLAPAQLSGKAELKNQCCGSTLGLKADPDTDPNPAIFVKCGFGSGSSDPGFWWPKNGKNIQGKNIIFFSSKIAIYLFLSLDKGLPSYRKSLHSSKVNILHFKTWIFFTFVGHFGPLGSGSVSPMRIRILLNEMNAGLCGSGSTTLVKSIKMW